MMSGLHQESLKKVSQWQVNEGSLQMVAQITPTIENKTSLLFTQQTLRLLLCNKNIFIYDR